MKCRVQGRAKTRRLLAMLGVDRARAPLKTIVYPRTPVVFYEDEPIDMEHYATICHGEWVSYTAKVTL